MAVPKQRISISRRRIKQQALQLIKKELHFCNSCNSSKLRHHICLICRKIQYKLIQISN